MGWHTFSVAAPSVWNSVADYLRDSALGLDSFRRQLKTLFAHRFYVLVLIFLF